jgi:carboxyl-terminal processing protease
MLENETGYIHLYSFSSNSAAEFKSAFESLLDEGATKLIVDLRSNSGGFVDTAVDITSTFLPSGTILIEEWGDGTRNEYVANEDPIDIDIPLVILVDAGSASASEIMAGALQDYERATLIGTSTFGKGLIQNWIPLVNDSGAVRVTIARWLTPEEQQIQDNGLNPDILVEFTEEDIEAGIDVQLGAALDFLTDSNATTAESDNN